jgi:hypothetical protein
MCGFRLDFCSYFVLTQAMVAGKLHSLLVLACRLSRGRSPHVADCCIATDSFVRVDFFGGPIPQSVNFFDPPMSPMSSRSSNEGRGRCLKQDRLD